MIGHGAYPQIEDDPDRPATLSWRLATDLLRNAIGFDGCAVSVNEDANVRARFEEAKRRCDVYRAHCDRLRAAAPTVASFEDVESEHIRYLEEFERTRPEREVVVPETDRRHNPRTPGKGRTGREEWT